MCGAISSPLSFDDDDEEEDDERAVDDDDDEEEDNRERGAFVAPNFLSFLRLLENSLSSSLARASSSSGFLSAALLWLRAINDGRLALLD